MKGENIRKIKGVDKKRKNLSSFFYLSCILVKNDYFPFYYLFFTKKIGYKKRISFLQK